MDVWNDNRLQKQEICRYFERETKDGSTQNITHILVTETRPDLWFLWFPQPGHEGNLVFFVYIITVHESRSDYRKMKTLTQLGTRLS